MRNDLCAVREMNMHQYTGMPRKYHYIISPCANLV